MSGSVLPCSHPLITETSTPLAFDISLSVICAVQRIVWRDSARGVRLVSFGMIALMASCRSSHSSAVNGRMYSQQFEQLTAPMEQTNSAPFSWHFGHSSFLMSDSMKQAP